MNVYVPTFLRPTCCAGKQQADFRKDNVYGGIGFSKEEAKTFGQLCTYQRPSRVVDPGDIRGNSAGFADFCSQFLVRDGGIGLLLLSARQDTRGETGGICNIAAILKMKDPDRGEWVQSPV